MVGRKTSYCVCVCVLLLLSSRRCFFINNLAFINNHQLRTLGVMVSSGQIQDTWTGGKTDTVIPITPPPPTHTQEAIGVYITRCKTPTHTHTLKQQHKNRHTHTFSLSLSHTHIHTHVASQRATIGLFGSRSSVDASTHHSRRIPSTDHRFLL